MSSVKDTERLLSRLELLSQEITCVCCVHLRFYFAKKFSPNNPISFLRFFFCKQIRTEFIVEKVYKIRLSDRIV